MPENMKVVSIGLTEIEREALRRCGAADNRKLSPMGRLLIISALVERGYLEAPPPRPANGRARRRP